ncbi:hypothetical protein DFJ74DRAFT_661427 [Hyaloraphidium curvatum]|nr:hypothetical protein DFJ74DRAFT_661427 [Hyaloraphidium curvatum]
MGSTERTRVDCQAKKSGNGRAGLPATIAVDPKFTAEELHVASFLSTRFRAPPRHWAAMPSFPTAILAGITAVNLFRGSAHVFLPDSGLVRIAGMSPQDPALKRMIPLMGIVGVDQLVFAALGALVLVRERLRGLRTLLLALATASSAGYSLIWFVLKPQHGTFPGRNGNLRMAPVLLAATILSLRESDWDWGI